MTNRKSHVTKSPTQRVNYNRYIERQDYEPTVDDALPFAHSSQSGEDLREPTSRRKRTINMTERILDHFQDHYLTWIFSGIIIVLIYLMFESKVDFARIHKSLEFSGKNISSLDFDMKKKTEKDSKQDLNINENRIKIGVIEKTLDSVKSK